MSALVSVYRNLKLGREWNNHAWSVCEGLLRRDGQPKASRGKLFARVHPGQSLVMVNAQAVYAGGETRARIKATRKREVFAWFTGQWVAPSALRPFTVGRRLGMNVTARGEVAFCFADTREACPANFAGLLFNKTGVYALEFNR